MWAFQLRCWSTITQRNLALFTRCTTSCRTITSFGGVRIFLRDNIIICILSTLRVCLLESNHNAALANSVLRIYVALSIESFWTYAVVKAAKSTKDRTLLEFTISFMQIWKRSHLSQPVAEVLAYLHVPVSQISCWVVGSVLALLG